VAFDESKANFSGLCHLPDEQKAYISQVRHKTFVEVNERGSEAAAATSIEMIVTAAAAGGREPSFQMIVDRPFFCVIRDDRTGMILFMGSIVNP
jgi:serpin B